MSPRRHLFSTLLLGLAAGLGAAEQPPWVTRGVDWLVAAQHADGGWGAGSHAARNIRDAQAAATDPATTAFVALALIRHGNTPDSGAHAGALRRALEHLCAVVEQAPANSPSITALQRTQIQSKLGPLIDTAMTTQVLARALPLCTEPGLQQRVDAALDRCLTKLAQGQTAEGHWGGGGWAPVLQASAACMAMEFAQASGKTIDLERLKRAREFQTGNTRAPAEADAMNAGVELYGFAGSQRANASEARTAATVIEAGIRDGRLEAGATVDEDNLRKVLGEDGGKAAELATSWQQNNAQKARILSDDRLLSGFGNNGGEEFLSYLMTSESLVIDGGDEYAAWIAKMSTLLAQAQNPDGSWSGHHCITSPAFCTAAVLQVMTVGNEAEYLRSIATVAKGPAVEAKP